MNISLLFVIGVAVGCACVRGDVYVDASSGCASGTPACVGDSANPFQTIQQGLFAVSSGGGRVIVRAGRYAGPGNTNITFISADLTVLSESGSANTIVDCANYGYGFNLVSGTFTFGGFTIQNCVRQWLFANQVIGGAAIAITSTYSVLSDLVITGNTGYSTGGAIAIYSNTVEIYNSTISHNRVVNGTGGGIWIASAFLHLVNTTVSGNTADGGRGDDLYCQSATVQVSNASAAVDAVCVSCSVVNDAHQSLCQQTNTAHALRVSAVVVLAALALLFC